MKRALAALALAAALLAGCDDADNGRKQADRITRAIHDACGVNEGGDHGGVRTVTPIDLDGSDGPSGFLVSCISGQVVYVEAVE